MTKWLWGLYPIAVIVLIAVSGKWLFIDQAKWETIFQDEAKIQEQQVQIANLKIKLGILEKVNYTEETNRLAKLLEAMPTKKAIWLLVSQLKSAAEENGVVISDYRGGTGGVREATEGANLAETETNLVLSVHAEVDNLASLRGFLGKMSLGLPMVRVNKIEYGTGKVKLEIESAWKGWEKVAEEGNELPDYKSKLDQVTNRLSEFETAPIAEIAIASESGEVVVNPF